jgi:hypothetical protein
MSMADTISPSDPLVILSGIKQFGLAADGSDLRDLTIAVYRLTRQLAEAQGYATRLATSLWEEHWKNDAPEWKPLPDLIGVLTQIDNACAGLVRPDKQHAAAMGTEK